MADKKSELNTRVVIKCRISYAKVWQPGSYEGSEDKKYSVSCLILKKDKDQIKKIRQAIENAKTIARDRVWEGKIPKNLKAEGLRDGDELEREDEAYKNCYFVNASSKIRPSIVKKEDGKTMAIEDQTEVYSGCYCYVAVNFYGYNWKGNKGITAGLNHILKYKDGEPLGGIGSAEEAFEDIEIDEDEEDDDDIYG